MSLIPDLLNAKSKDIHFFISTPFMAFLLLIVHKQGFEPPQTKMHDTMQQVGCQTMIFGIPFEIVCI